VLSQIDKAYSLTERFGGESDGEFAPGGVPISRIAEEHGTPFYLYHGEMIVERVRRVREALGTEVAFSLKANPNLAVCQLIASQMRMGGTVGQFGIDQADLAEAVRRTLSHPQLNLRGVHVYTATQVFEV